MKTILVCNQKGGVGKSLVADEIAFSFERSGIPVSFYDLDTQGGTLHETHEADGAQVAVVDTPGALQEGLADWLKEADVVVIPTRTTSRDIEPLMRMRKAVFKNSRAKIVYVMNGWNRFKASRDFMVFVSSSGFQLRQRFFSHVARKGFRFGKGVPLSLFGFA
ncbi:ParA family protein, partial [Collinsella sp. HCP28S3_E5]|uniref:ParA family protein n=1 Tax=Collinsella sp. HCP28S3_E5 TaxID=3438922 RepID=UPI003F8A28CF